MKKSTIIILSIVGAFCLFGFGSCSYVLSKYNRAKGLQNNYESKIKANEATFDNVWKTIQQAAQIPNEKKKAFKEILESYTSNRGGNDGQLVTMVREAVPNLDLNIYDELTRIIVGTRSSWTTNQKELVAISEEYNGMLATQPSGFILSMFGLEKIDPKIISSDKTEEVFRTNKDNDVKLF